MINQQLATVERRNLDDHDRGTNSDVDDDWPICENVLQSLSEDVRPTTTDDDDAAVAAVVVDVGVEMCLSERVAPTTVTGRWLRLPQQWRLEPREDSVVAARRMQIRLMSVRSAYSDGKYYSPEAPYVSRTVEELQTVRPPTANDYTYTAGTVLYDKGACHLHGFVEPQNRVAVDCSLLTAALPRHRSTVKIYSVIKQSVDGTVVLVPHHFQTFSCNALFH